LTLVDNWVDWEGTKPDFVKNFKNKVKLVESDELSFVFEKNKTMYDFIFSDADHWNTQKMVRTCISFHPKTRWYIDLPRRFNQRVIVQKMLLGFLIWNRS